MKALEHHAGVGVGGDAHFQRRCHVVLLRQVDVVADARAPGFPGRGQCRHGTRRARHHRALVPEDLERWKLGLGMGPRAEIGPPARVRDDQLGGPVVTVRTGDAEGRDRQRHKLRMRPFEGRRIKPKSDSPQPGFVVDQDVGPAEQFIEFAPFPGVRDIQADPALVDVERQERAALLRLFDVVRKGPAPPYGIAIGRFHLDHVRAVIAQEFRRVGGRDAAAQFKDAYGPDTCGSVIGYEKIGQSYRPRGIRANLL